MSYQKPSVIDIPVERKQEIANLLSKKGIALAPCSLCKHDSSNVLDVIDVFEMDAQDLLVIPRPPNTIGTFPNKRNTKIAAVICKGCGHRSEFHLDILERTPTKEGGT